jgi:hypothetical protein
MKALWYVLAVVLCLLGLFNVLRILALATSGGVSAYGAGQLTGALLFAIILFALAWKSWGKARQK